MIRGLLVILSMGIAFCCSAQTAKQSLISPYLKTGAYNHNRGDIFSFSANQANLASLSGKDERTAKRWLSGEFEPPGCVMAALIAKLYERGQSP